MTALAQGNISWPPLEAMNSIAAEVAVTLTVIATLLYAFVTSRPSKTVSGGIAVGGLLVAFLLTIFLKVPAGTYFGGHIIVDPAALFWKQILLLFTAGVILIWFATTRHAQPASDTPEFFTLLLSATVGMMLMGSTTHLLLLLLAMEIASMPSYVLAGFRKNRRPSAEASLKFALFGAVCTATMIYGMSFLYGTHGSLKLEVIVESLRTAPSLPATTVIGLTGIAVGLFFKLAAVPVHFWCPDAFEGAHTDITAFLSAASKGAGIVVLARWAPMLAEASPALSQGMAIALAAAAAATMTFGNLGALRQQSVKRLLAYSSISHAGYILCALALVMPQFSDGAITAVAVYLAVYFVLNLGAF
ncbi:MAG TPA: NADH-quinone oxidoreductase subunit N, partial [Tepidisphaeraceae bacterium]